MMLAFIAVCLSIVACAIRTCENATLRGSSFRVTMNNSSKIFTNLSVANSTIVASAPVAHTVGANVTISGNKTSMVSNITAPARVNSTSAAIKTPSPKRTYSRTPWPRITSIPSATPKLKYEARPSKNATVRDL